MAAFAAVQESVPDLLAGSAVLQPEQLARPIPQDCAETPVKASSGDSESIVLTGREDEKGDAVEHKEIRAPLAPTTEKGRSTNYLRNLSDFKAFRLANGVCTLWTGDGEKGLQGAKSQGNLGVCPQAPQGI